MASMTYLPTLSGSEAVLLGLGATAVWGLLTGPLDGWRKTPGGRALKAVRATTLAICRTMTEPVIVQMVRDPNRSWMVVERELAIKCSGDVVIRCSLTPQLLGALEELEERGESCESSLKLWRAIDAEGGAKAGRGRPTVQ